LLIVCAELQTVTSSNLARVRLAFHWRIQSNKDEKVVGVQKS